MGKRGFVAGTLRWLKRIGLGLLVIVIAATAFGAIYEFNARQQARQDYPPPGQLVDIGGRNMHIDCRGEGSPTVILESGLDTNGSLAWDKVHDDLAAITRTCAYDRAGVMWSEPKATPQSADAVAQDLHATLAAAGIDGPLVMVCHSLGGPYIMSYTRQYPDEVKGLVFVDCSHPDQIERMPENIARSMQVPAVFKILSALSWAGVAQLLPASDVPGMPERIKPIGKAYFGETFGASLKEMEAIPATFKQAGQLRDLGDRPLVVLTAMQAPSGELLASQGLTVEDGRQMQVVWKELNLDEASWSRRGRQQDVPDSQHYIQFQRPDVVIEAVAEVLDAVRTE
jgi:pimeloyl-ACP methyl ester carboxylesterase